MELPPDVTADMEDQDYVDVPMHEQEGNDFQNPEVIKEPNENQFSGNVENDEELPPIEQIDTSPLEDPIFLDMPKEYPGIVNLGRNCMKHHSVFLVLILSLHIVLTIFSIATVPFYLTIIRLVTSIVGFVGIRFRKRPFIMFVFLGMLLQLIMITPIAALYSIITIFFNNWSSGGKFFVIFLLIILFTMISCVESCGFLKTIKLMRTRRGIHQEEEEERKSEEEGTGTTELEESIEEDPVVPLSMSSLSIHQNGSIQQQQQQQPRNSISSVQYMQQGNNNVNSQLEVLPVQVEAVEPSDAPDVYVLQPVSQPISGTY